MQKSLAPRWAPLAPHLSSGGGSGVAYIIDTAVPPHPLMKLPLVTSARQTLHWSRALAKEAHKASTYWRPSPNLAVLLPAKHCTEVLQKQTGTGTTALSHRHWHTFIWESNHVRDTLASNCHHYAPVVPINCGCYLLYAGRHWHAPLSI